MKILVFEYIVGGGLSGQSLPPSLAAEGGLMLQALINDLKFLPDLRLLVPLDRRYTGLALPLNAEIIPIAEDQDVIALLPELMASCDAVWPVAPESDGLLAGIAEMIVAQRKTLLLSSPEAVYLCGDKLSTYCVLSANDIPVVETRLLSSLNDPGVTRSVIKPVDGVGCLGGIIVDNHQTFQQAISGLNFSERHIIQPYCEGPAISLSCLFKRGKGWLICCNQQQIDIVDDRFVLRGCLVNVVNLRHDYYQGLVERIAKVIPCLWGYIGIDIVETPDRGPLVLEINPRLTTSYVGISEATGINVAEQVLRLLEAEPDLQPSHHRAVNIAIT